MNSEERAYVERALAALVDRRYREVGMTLMAMLTADREQSAARKVRAVAGRSKAKGQRKLRREMEELAKQLKGR